jgi:uncharacterized protein (DUF1501 family)
MKRRDFLKYTAPAATILPAVINGYSVKAFNQQSPLVKALMSAGETDKVLVIIQLSGGNDGLNTVIPLEQYAAYYNARTNIAIPQNRVLTLNGNTKTGLNTAMTGMQALYNDGKLKIVQSVGYPAPNFSHFRATDIWMSGSASNQFIATGWSGRYLNTEFPNFPNGFPNAQMPDPLAIQIGSVTSLTFQGPGVNMAMSISNPTNFYNFLNGVQDPAPNTPAGKELKYVRLVAQQTQQYADAVKNAALRVTQQVTYPTNNSLADQLKIVARLVKGGLKTRVYMVSFGGFDTHALQTNVADTTTGAHATLLGRVSAAIKAFQDDLKFLGVEERVLGMTFSEFGRRIKSNSSTGTDHGAAAPLFLFGAKVLPGVLGNNPTIPTNASVNDNIPFQYDFRSIYASILEKWFCVPKTELQMIMTNAFDFNNYQSLPIIDNAVCRGVTPVTSGDNLIYNYPNPFTSNTTITFQTNGGHTLIQIIDTLGRVIKTLVDREYVQAGQDTVPFSSDGLPAGVYYARLQNETVQQVRAMLKVR